MTKKRVLVDLVLGHKKMGFSGIPQDTRLLFSGLSISDKISPTGMLWSNAAAWHGGPLNNIESQSVFLGPFLQNPPLSFSARVLGKFSHRIGNIFEHAVINNIHQKYSLNKLVDPVLKDMIWRQIFASTVSPSERQTVLNQNFALSNLGIWPVSDAMLLRKKRVKLETSGYNAIVFQDSRSVSVSAETQKFIRYHDGLPTLASDTMMNEWYTKLHIRSIEFCAKDSVYVCNSTSAKQDLFHLCPEAAEKAVVIPYFVPRIERSVVDAKALFELAAIRLSPSTMNPKSTAIETAYKWFGLGTYGKEKTISIPTKIPDFILSLATIEPRKNYQGLIRAWSRLRIKTGKDIKLVIIGKPGWEFDAIINDMKAYVSSGDLLHLQGVAQDELAYWYTAAQCFAFPSVAEGFGLPPIEAMQCGTPVMASDIPAHRYSCGDAALFCDPYDPADMTDKLEQLLNEPKAERAKLGYRNAERFTRNTVLPLWEELFATGTVNQ